MKKSSTLIFISIRKIIFTLGLCLSLNMAYAGNLTSSISRSQITLNDTIQLVLRYDESTKETPDFSPLQKDFDILTSQTSTNRTIINGSYSVYTQWILVLAPKREGRLLIPSLSLDNSISDAIAIDVTKQAAAEGDSPILFESTISSTSTFVQEQILLTLRLKVQTGVNLVGGNLEPLNVKDALVVGFDEKKSRIRENNKEYDVIEYEYAIFPQTSGELFIPSQLLQLEIASNQWDSRSFFSTNRGNMQRFRSDENRITVKPVPQDNRATPWLPAQGIKITEHWSSSPDELYVGDPITRTLTITAQGLSGVQLPALPQPSLANLNIYQDQAQTDDQKINGAIVGSRTETAAIVANKSGNYELPEISVNWWNTTTQQFETATLPATRLIVNSKLGEQSADVSSAYNSTMTDSSMDSSREDKTVASQMPWWFTILLTASVVLNILLLLSRWFSQRRQQKNHSSNRAIKTGIQKQNEQHEREAWHNLKQQFKSEHAGDLRKAIIQWTAIRFNDSTITSLERVSSLLEDENAQAQLHIIDAALFGNANISTLDKDVLEQALKKLRKGHIRNDHKDTPLYPE